jgi:chromosome segregation ATPase
MTIKRTIPFLFLIACGGGGAKYKVDDVALAQIPVAEKQSIFAAENEISVAKSEHGKALADAQAVDHDLDIADKEQDQAKLETQKAKLESQAAEQSHDMNRVGAATRELKIADVGERAASAKVDWLSRKKKWFKALADVAEYRIAVAQSKVELEKARLAVAKNIKPSDDFKIDNFAQDYAKRTKEWQEEKRDADQMRAQVDQFGKTYDNLKAQYMQLRAPATALPLPPTGPSGVAPAPAAPAPAPQAAPPPAQ